MIYLSLNKKSTYKLSMHTTSHANVWR